MIKIKNLLKTYTFIFSLLLIYTLFISFFYYKELLSYNAINIINYGYMIILFFILGFKYSKCIDKKGYLSGFISSAILILFFALFSLIITTMNISSLIYYLSLILSSITGGIISHQRKK